LTAAEWGDNPLLALAGGTVRRGETPEAAARRELAEEVGLATSALFHVGFVCGTWDGHLDRVHVFELRLDALPKPQLINREIIGAPLWSADELRGVAATGPVAVYLGRQPPARCRRSP